MQSKEFEIKEFNIYGISSGVKNWTCPECSHTRKPKNQKVKCMSVFWDRGVGSCNHCGALVQLHSYTSKESSTPHHHKAMSTPARVYSKPKPTKGALTQPTLDWFASRGIRELTLNALKVTQSVRKMPPEWHEMETIHFNYFENEELINIKYRGKQKRFALEKGARLIPYNMDVCRLFKEIVIVEGEMDVLSYVQSGVINTTSTPNGSTLKNVNLDWLDDNIDFFDSMDKIYLALDADEAGQNVTTELVRRLGASRCYLVDFKGCIDANEYMSKYGEEALKDTITCAREVPITGVSSVLDWEDEFDNYVVNGMQKGYGIGCASFDKIFTTYTGQYIVVTGKPSCVLGDTEVLMADGSSKQIKNVNKGDSVISISEQFNSETDIVSNKWVSGIKPIYEMELQSGKRLKATKEHGVLTFDGWRKLGDLNIGDFVAVPNNISFDSDTVSVDDAKLTALWIADGNKNHNSYYFSNGSEELVSDIREICERNKLKLSFDGEFGYIISEIKKPKSSRERYISKMSYSYRKRYGLSFADSVEKATEKYEERIKDEDSLFNPVDMLKSYGLIGMKTNTVRVPIEIFRQSNKLIGHFLNYIFACDGNVSAQGLEYTSISRMLCVDISSLLSRFGITSYINLKKVKYNGGYNYAYTLSVNGYENVEVFKDEIGIIGKNEGVDGYLGSCKRMVSSKLRDYVPSTVKKSFIHGDKYYRKHFGISISKNSKTKMRFSRRLATIVAEHENNTELTNKVANNVRWEQITKISYIGELETYDIEVAKNHNFIANDILVHNSGKSDWVDQMTGGYAMLHGWKTAIASPENMPYTIHTGKVMSKLAGTWVNKKEYLSQGWYKKGKEFIHDYYKYIELKRFGLEEVLERTKELIKRYGIKVLVIDPYNKVRLHSSLHKGINDYTNDYLNMIDEFAREHDILIFLVAHPVKPSGEERATYEPDFYSIKGGGEFYDMSPHGLLVHRDYENEMVKIKVLKVKFNHLGENHAHCWQSWNKSNGRYMDWKFQSEEALSTSGLVDDSSNWLRDMYKDIPQAEMDFSDMVNEDSFMSSTSMDDVPF